MKQPTNYRLVILCSDPDCAGVVSTIADDYPTALYNKRCPECNSNDLDMMRLSDYYEMVSGGLDYDS